AIGLLGLAASLGYAGGPLPYASRGWADLFFLLMFGVVAVVGAYYIQAVSLVAAPGAWATRWIPLGTTVFWIGLADRGGALGHWLEPPRVHAAGRAGLRRAPGLLGARGLHGLGAAAHGDASR